MLVGGISWHFTYFETVTFLPVVCC